VKADTTAAWLVDNFALTADDARANGTYALRLAKQNGYTGIVDWLENFIGSRVVIFWKGRPA
jgi:hypothetical protein